MAVSGENTDAFCMRNHTAVVAVFSYRYHPQPRSLIMHTERSLRV